MATTKKAKTLFQHLSGLKESKTSWDSLSVMDKKTFEPFMVNRFLSMNMGLLELVNELQKFTIGQLSPRDVYKMYLDFLPKKRSFDKYIKGKIPMCWGILQSTTQYHKEKSETILKYLVKTILLKYC